MSDRIYYRRVDFNKFKAFNKYRIDLNEFNILVGPNNAGKSTVIAAFRILAAAIRKAESRRAEIVSGPMGQVRGYKVDLAPISVAEENIFYNYDDDETATIIFTMSNGFTQTLYFPEQGICHYIVDAGGNRLKILQHTRNTSIVASALFQYLVPLITQSRFMGRMRPG